MVLIYIDPLTSIVCSLVFVVTVCLRYFSVVMTEVCDLVIINKNLPAMITLQGMAEHRIKIVFNYQFFYVILY